LVEASPTLLRWSAHVGFWLGYFLLRSAVAATTTETSDLLHVQFRVLVCLGHALLTGLLLLAIAGRDARGASLRRNLLLVASSIGVAPLAQHIEVTWVWLLTGHWEWPPPFVRYMFSIGWVLPLWALTQAMLGAYIESLAYVKSAARAHALAYEAQLRALHYQINPHFLFNTLTAISELALSGNVRQADEVLQRLSKLLRYTLDRPPERMATLAEEFGAQREYLEIQQVRFGARLRFEFSLAAELQTALVPSWIMQPVLENAIKHAIATRQQGGVIRIGASACNDVLRITVEDDGPGLQLKPGARQGIGLRNVSERLALLYAGKAGLELTNLEPTGCRAEMWLPLKE